MIQKLAYFASDALAWRLGNQLVAGFDHTIMQTATWRAADACKRLGSAVDKCTWILISVTWILSIQEDLLQVSAI